MKKLFAIIFGLQLMLAPIPTAHAGGIGSMANQLRGIAIASIGATIITTCKLGALSPSLKIFMGAALVYAAGELAAGKGQKSSLESKSSEVDSTMGGKGGKTQLETLEAQLKDKEEKKKVADKRAMFTAASMALMLAAAVVAITEIPRQYPPVVPPLPPLGCVGPEALAKGKLTAAGITAGFTFLTGGGMMESLIGGIGVYLGAMSFLVTAMNMAEGRAKVFGALAAFTGLALMDAKSESGKLGKEIEQLKKLIAEFKKETDGEGPNSEDTTAGASGGVTSGADGGVLAGVTSGSSSGSSSGAGPGGTIKSLPDVQTSSTSKTCFSAAGFSSDCSNPVRVPSANLNGLGTGPEIQQVASQGADLANNIATGTTGAKADIAAAALASSAGRINDELKKQMAKTNSTLRGLGKKPMDFDKEVADTVKSFNNAAQNEAAKSGNSNLASLGVGNAVLDPNAASKTEQDIGGASADSAVAIPTAKGDAASAVAEPTATDALANAAASTADANKVSAADALGNNLDQYESVENDISNKSGESLWKQVSNRYLLNYDRIFERKKPAEKAPAQ